MRLQVANSTTTVYYSVTNAAPAKPYLQISNQYLPLTTATLQGIKLKVQSGTTTYRACTYQSGYYNTTSAAVGNLSSTTALTRSSISGYATRSSISGYATRSSISGYATRSSISGYATRSSISGYATRSSISGYATRSSISGYATSVSTVKNNSTTMSTFTYEGQYTSYSNYSSNNDRYGVVRLFAGNGYTYRACGEYITTATHPTYGTLVKNNIYFGDVPSYMTQTDPETNIYHITDVTALTASHNIMGASKAIVSMYGGPRMHAAGYMVSGQMGYTSYVTLTNGQTVSSTTWIGNTADTETRWFTQIMGRGWGNTNSTYTFNVTGWSSFTTNGFATVISNSSNNYHRTSTVYYNSTYYPYLTNTYLMLKYTATTSGYWANSTLTQNVTWITNTNKATTAIKTTVTGGWHVTVSFADVGLPKDTVISSTKVVTSATLTRSSTSATLTRSSTSATLTRSSTSATLTRSSTSATLTKSSTSATLTRSSTSATLTRSSTSATLTKSSISAYSGKLSSSKWA